MQNPPRLVFAGTPGFARVVLRALLEARRVPVAVVTQPDRPAGRGRKLTASPVKQLAREAGLPVLQPETLRDAAAVAAIANFRPDALIVAAYGLLLPRPVLDLPLVASINVHASLLPRWRGASPVQAAILAGDPETGVSLMQMEQGLDCGGVYVQQAVAIGSRETAGELEARLAGLGAELLVASLDDILEGRLPARPQDERQASYAGKLSRADGRLDWRRPAVELARRVRAFNPAPGAWFEVNGEPVKCWSAEAVDGEAAPGSLLDGSAREPVVACGRGALRLDVLQRPGRGRVSGRELADRLRLTSL